MLTKINIYENDKLVNKADNKEDFIREYETMTKKIHDKENEIKKLDDKELARILNEFEKKNYLKRY